MKVLIACEFTGTVRRALRQLHTWPTPTSRLTVRYVVLPGDPEFDMVDAFKILCDTRRACSDGPVKVPDTLLCRGLGIDPPVSGVAAELARRRYP